MRVLAAVLGITFLAIVSGCTPDPTEVCNKMVELYGELAKKGGEKIDDKRTTRQRDRCIKRLKRMKKKKKKMYKCVANCVMGSSDFETAIGCRRKCK